MNFDTMFSMGPVLYAGAGGLILIGLFAMIAARHVLRMIIGLVLVESGVNLLLITIGYKAGAVAPIITDASANRPMVDPLPQALVLTAIVIGAGVLALALALMIRASELCGTLDVRELAAIANREEKPASHELEGTS
jgi:multisubunit Na+/H+ antiporter MnhC subunit